MSKYFIEDGQVFRADVYEPVSVSELKEEQAFLKLQFAVIKDVLAQVEPAVETPAPAPVVADVIAPQPPVAAPIVPDQPAIVAAPTPFPIADEPPRLQ